MFIFYLPEELSRWYDDNGRGQTDVHVQICVSFQKSMFCVTNAAIKGTFPHPLDSTDQAEQEANAAYANAWASRLVVARTNALG